MRPLQALFLCDGSPSVGGGHVMRSLTLAQALAERGWRSTFLADGFVGSLIDRHDRVGCARLAVADCAPDTLTEAAAEAAGFDAIIFDHFGMEARHETAAPTPVRVAVDDLADRPHAVDLLIDCNLQRTPADYETRAPGAELLLGPRYAPVRPEFAARREATLKRRETTPAEPGRVLVSLGLTDVGGVTERVVEVLLERDAAAGFDVVVGQNAPSREALVRRASAGASMTLHSELDAAAMAALMSDCDMAVGAGGSSIWERVTLGLATVTLVLADNQEPGARALERQGATVVVDARQPDALETLVRVLHREAFDKFWAMGRRAADLCDGLGAGRTADRLTARVQSGARQ